MTEEGINVVYVNDVFIPWHWTVLILLSQLHWDGHMAATWFAITINMASITAIIIVMMYDVTHSCIVMVLCLCLHSHCVSLCVWSMTEEWLLRWMSPAPGWDTSESDGGGGHHCSERRDSTPGIMLHLKQIMNRLS